HGLAMPTWERKWRVLWGWWHNLWLGRDIVNLETVQNPRYVFEEFAARPRPAAAATPAPAKVEAAEKPADAPAAEKAPAKADAAKASAKKPAAKAPAKKKADVKA